MKPLATQYLEYAPPEATPVQVRQRLRQAFDLLPISMVILGWDLPSQLEEAVAAETSQHKAALYRWHLLLASEAGCALPGGWQPTSLQGEPVPGYKGLPEFTFLCPNHPEVQAWIAQRIEVAAQRGIYQGLFFDRMRYPSPAENPERQLACFCQHCQRAASQADLDLQAVRRHVEALFSNIDGAKTFTQALFSSTSDVLLESFFNFRLDCITQTIQYAARTARSRGLDIGLDCFSPTLTRLVGQDLAALDKSCDWIKIMTYPRVFGPAGLPFELGALAKWLETKYPLTGAGAVELVNAASGLPLTPRGLGSASIAHEIQVGRQAGITTLLVGLALVEMAGIHTPTLAQMQADMAACNQADGAVLSWDLWHIPPKVLSLMGSGKGNPTWISK